MITPLEILIVGLAAYRLWRLLALDEILDRPRQALPDPVRGWLECPHCSGFFVALSVALTWTFVPIVVWHVLAISAVVSIVGSRDG